MRRRKVITAALRLLAAAGKSQRVFDLADVLEPLPGWLASWRDDYWTAIRGHLETYAAKYPAAFEYLKYLDEYEPPLF